MGYLFSSAHRRTQGATELKQLAQGHSHLVAELGSEHSHSPTTVLSPTQQHLNHDKQTQTSLLS